MTTFDGFFTTSSQELYVQFWDPKLDRIRCYSIVVTDDSTPLDIADQLGTLSSQLKTEFE